MEVDWGVIGSILNIIALVVTAGVALAKFGAKTDALGENVKDMGGQIAKQAESQQAMTIELTKIAGKMEKSIETTELKLSHVVEKVEKVADLDARVATTESALRRMEGKEAHYDKWWPNVERRLNRVDRKLGINGDEA